MPWFAPLVIAAVLAGLASSGSSCVRACPRPDWAWRVAADPLPEEMDTAAERDAWTAANVRVWSWSTLEKVVLIGLLSTIYARILPGLEVSDLRMFMGIAAYVVVNAAISSPSPGGRRAARGCSPRSGSASSSTWGWCSSPDSSSAGSALSESDTLFFVLLLSLLVTLHDRFAPVGVARAAHDRSRPGAGSACPPEPPGGLELGVGQLAQHLGRPPVEPPPTEDDAEGEEAEPVCRAEHERDPPAGRPTPPSPRQRRRPAG